VSFGSLLVRFSPWAVVMLVLAGLPAFLAEAKFSGEAFRLFRWRAPESRMQIVSGVGAGATRGHAKEVKLFQLGPRLLQRYREIFTRLYREDRDLTMRRDSWGFGTRAGGHGCDPVRWLCLDCARRTALGAMTVGQMTMYLMLFRQGQSAVSAALTAVGGMYEDNLVSVDTVRVSGATLWGIRRARIGTGPVPQPGDGIRFEDVDFVYPGAAQPRARTHRSARARPARASRSVGSRTARARPR
jgi:ATP-binding cassette subfamily B protein